MRIDVRSDDLTGKVSVAVGGATVAVAGAVVATGDGLDTTGEAVETGRLPADEAVFGNSVAIAVAGDPVG